MTTGPPDYVRFDAERRLLHEHATEGMFMSVKECERIKKRVRAISEPLQWPKTLAWTAITLGIGSLLALWQWNPNYELLPVAAQLRYSWVGTTLLAIPIFAPFLAGACVLFLKNNRDQIVHDKQAVLDLIEAIEERYEREANPENQSSSAAIS